MRKHRLRKFIIIFASILTSLAIILGIIVIDFEDNTPSYTKELGDITLSDYLSNKAKKDFQDSILENDFEYLFDEKELNEVLSLVTPYISIPFTHLSSIYLHIDENDNIKAYAPFWFLFYKSMARVDGFLSYDKEQVILELDDIRIRELSSRFGIVKGILSPERIEDIDKALDDVGVELTMWKEEEKIFVKMTNIDICLTIIQCTKNGIGLLSSALAAGTLNSRSVELVINQEGKTGVIIHKLLL